MFMTNKLVNRLCTKGLGTTCKYNELSQILMRVDINFSTANNFKKSA